MTPSVKSFPPTVMRTPSSSGTVPPGPGPTLRGTDPPLLRPQPVASSTVVSRAAARRLTGEVLVLVIAAPSG